MLIVISPAKTLDMDTAYTGPQLTTPAFLERSKQLVEQLKKMTPAELSELMSISPKLAQLNFERFQEWQTPYINEKTRPAVFAFRGDVFTGLDIDSFSDEDLLYTQDHLRILSGLYGLLRPLDAIMAYRLEMGTRLSVGNAKDLYDFWGEEITRQLKATLKSEGSNTLVNLASNEYFKSIRPAKLGAEIVTPVFKDFKNGQYKVISFFAKKARGMMTRFILKNRIENPEEIKHFEEGGYYFNPELSSPQSPTFTRG